MIEIIRRVLIAALLVLVMLFCVYGFMATYEPLPRNVQLTWRLAYGGLIAACLGGITRQVFPKRPKQ